MKLIHLADVHLGSKIDSKFPKDVSDALKTEIHVAFMNVIEYAKQNGISVIMISGDLFDSDHPFKKDKDLFYSVVEKNPDIDFLYLRGNHDDGENSIEFANLKTFSGEWQNYTYGDVVISGIEFTKENYSAMYSLLSLDANKKNIVMMHGQVSDSVGYESVCLKKLANKNVDYLALGHVHIPSLKKLDDRGEYAYCGCLVGRGFDEIGKRGFYVVDTDYMKNVEFVSLSSRTIYKVEVDVSNTNGIWDVKQAVKNAVDFSEKDIYRIELTGRINYDLWNVESEIKEFFAKNALFIDVKNNTKRYVDPKIYENDKTLRGEFVKTVYKNTDLTDDEKAEIVTIGLRALNGEEIF